MYRVLIVDDEPWVAYGLTKLIDWEGLGFTIVGEAHDGLSALASMKELKPDAVISDIRMPGLDGLELLERIASERLDAEVVFVSGYSEFEYAQKALRLGAFDYLLKQIEKPKLIETMTRLSGKLDKKRESFKELDLLLNDLFELFEPDNKIKIGNFLLSKGYAFDYPHFRFITGLCAHPSALASSMGAEACEGVNVIRFRTGQNKLSFLINYDEYGEPAGFLDGRTRALSGFEAVGVSSIGAYSTPLGKLYQESDIALFSRFGQADARVIEYKPADASALPTKSILPIEIAIKERKPDLIRRGLDELHAECASGHLYIDQIAGAYNQIVSLIYKHYANSRSLQEIEYLNYYQIVRLYGTPAQLFESLKAFFELQTGEDMAVSNEQVARIIAHIDASFTEDLLLSRLAERFNLSLGYLSQLIKKETGTTYSEYVTGKRLGLAKELLADCSLSVHEIVERVGYKDYFHFNKLFKKHFGVTPSKYRKI
ncbi:response regulator transcription factor [Paenibacillus arenilitoris]|uniref:Response regulator n=1 Tax=Paenibacillus arenilitoris TaxID=2772299 RepID=A0A927CL76_9BACL|nr:response regulator [Paenibacillus arenilitoris]MBD2868628.1 response regulator [Paenibacillus arenilitoris]